MLYQILHAAFNKLFALKVKVKTQKATVYGQEHQELLDILWRQLMPSTDLFLF